MGACNKNGPSSPELVMISEAMKEWLNKQRLKRPASTPEQVRARALLLLRERPKA